MKKLLILIIIASMIFVSACSKNEEEPVKPDEEESLIAPDFELEDLDGNMVKLSGLQGKKVIINFWATWCGYCVKEMPDLMKLQEEYKDDLVILYVNVGEAKEEVVEFVEKEKIKGTILLDTKQKVAATYGVRSFPSTLTINQKGEIITAREGMMSYNTMEQLYKAIK